jgi:type VI protein secretion system component Hcp
MAVDIFAKIGDIKGESTDSKHKDEVEVLSYSWVSQTQARSEPAVAEVPAGRPSKIFPSFTKSTRLPRGCCRRAPRVNT